MHSCMYVAVYAMYVCMCVITGRYCQLELPPSLAALLWVPPSSQGEFKRWWTINVCVYDQSFHVSGVTVIGYAAFFDTRLTSVTIPGYDIYLPYILWWLLIAMYVYMYDTPSRTVLTIGDEAFYYCPLKSVILSEWVVAALLLSVYPVCMYE
jgi:hypothetical protein